MTTHEYPPDERTIVDDGYGRQLGHVGPTGYGDHVAVVYETDEKTTFVGTAGTTDEAIELVRAWHRCSRCHGSGIVQVPSMLGYGVEDYVCSCPDGESLHPEYKDAIEEATAAWIHHAIR